MAIVIVLVAAAAAVLSYRLLEGWGGRNWIPAFCRAAGWGTVALLLVNASCPSVRPTVRPIVLLDASLSMQAAGGRWPEALALARQSGDVRPIGQLAGDTQATGGRSRVAGAIAAARSGSRPVLVITDGEVEDAEAVPADIMTGTSFRVLERRALSDVALVRSAGTTRLTPSDSLRIEAEAQTFGPARAWSLGLEVREGDRVWFRRPLAVDAGGRARVVLQGPLPQVSPGTHVLTVAITGAGDAEPRDDARLLVLTVVPTPGIVLLASPPTWESRFLLDALRDVAALPVRGYLETEPGRWRRSGDLKPASAREVADAARRADLLVTVGTPGAVTAGTRARGRWHWPGPAARPGAIGDWYLSVAPATPVSGAFAGTAVDSLPPGIAIADLSPTPRDWVGLNAQAGRRGTLRPVLLGRDSAAIRRITVGIDGLWRWAFRGGSSEQAYRALVANSVSWLLGGADSASGVARVVRDVVQRGRPAVFEWSGTGAAVPAAISFSGPDGTRIDTLAFDGAGRAELTLPPGVWHYRLAGGGQGTLAVEEYSDEWLPAPRTLATRQAGAAVPADRIPVRTWLWLFGVAVTAFAGEWLARRRLGLR